jgi:hypothetical protein
MATAGPGGGAASLLRATFAYLSNFWEAGVDVTFGP